MINGRILVSKEAEARWLQAALERDQERKEGSNMPGGWSLIVAEIDAQCQCWNFPPEDRKLLFDHMLELYDANRKFLDLPPY